MISLLLFDMDGVLIESVDAKTNAFRRAFSRYPVLLDEIMQYHIDNPGISRYEKIPYIFRYILNIPLTKQDEKELLSDLSEFVNEEMMGVELVSGCHEFFTRLSPSIPCAVVSAAPEEDATSILRTKGISKYFSIITGSPIGKKENAGDIIRHYQVDPTNVLFIGDAIADYEAAQHVGCRFIGRVRNGSPNPFINKPGVEHIIRDLFDLIRHIERSI